MYIEIISPEAEIYAGEAYLVQFPGTGGSFEVLKNHAPLISTLETGKVKIVSPSGEESFFDIDGGVVEVFNNKITVLTSKI